MNTNDSAKAFDALMQETPYSHFDSGCEGITLECRTCRFHRPHWKYQSCVFAECPYCCNPFQPSKIKVAHLMPERKPVMDNKIEVFKNEQFGEVRMILEGEKVLFCAADVAKALGYTNPNKAVNDHCRAITKRSTPMRTLPLVPFMRERLLTLKEEQQENRRLCGRSYIKDYLEYVCVNEIGDLIKPHYVTESFPKLLKAKGMRQIRYHDLRHSCASLLLANGVPMKQIQEWLGHSDFSTTANIYAHLDYSSKLTSADAMLNGLGFAAN